VKHTHTHTHTQTLSGLANLDERVPEMANAYKYEVISVGMLVQLSSATEADTATRPAVCQKTSKWGDML